MRHEAVLSRFCELLLRAVVPAPDQLPTVKAYRYVKASDEIVGSPSTKKDLNDRYSDALAQVALQRSTKCSKPTVVV